MPFLQPPILTYAHNGSMRFGHLDVRAIQGVSGGEKMQRGCMRIRVVCALATSI